jgi:hypothetical protein
LARLFYEQAYVLPTSFRRASRMFASNAAGAMHGWSRFTVHITGMRFMKLHTLKFSRAVCFYATALLSLGAMAQTDRQQMERCYGITANDARLACYDALVRPATPIAASPAPAATAPAPAAPPRAETATTAEAPLAARSEEPVTTENFGQQTARIEADAEGEAALVATVTAIDEVEPNKMLITLANGQVWRQSIGKSFLLRENDTVRIVRSPWGESFRLQKDGKPGYIQVLRQR